MNVNLLDWGPCFVLYGSHSFGGDFCFYLSRHEEKFQYNLTPINAGLIILHRKIAISPQQNIWWTRDKSINSSFICLGQSSRVSFSKYRNWDFWRFLWIFVKIIEFSRNSQGLILKARGMKFWNPALHIRIYNPH